MAHEEEVWTRLPLAELRPGDLIEDPGNHATWQIEHLTITKGIAKLRAGTFTRDAAPASQKFWALQRHREGDRVCTNEEPPTVGTIQEALLHDHWYLRTETGELCGPYEDHELRRLPRDA